MQQFPLSVSLHETGTCTIQVAASSSRTISTATSIARSPRSRWQPFGHAWAVSMAAKRTCSPVRSSQRAGGRSCRTSCRAERHMRGSGLQGSRDHSVPSKQLPAAQSHTRTSWLALGPQPQAPVAQVSGTSPVLAQHIAVVTVPPDPRQACSGVS
jgi:hypothetical protein